MKSVMNSQQRVLLVLFVVPVVLAQYYSLDRSLLSALSALASVSLLLFATTAMLGRLRRGTLRTTVGLTTIYLLSFYFAAQFVSYYLQGSYFNQQYYFHFNLTTLFETRAAYYPLLFLVLGWTACVLASFYSLRDRLPHSDRSLRALAGLFLLALTLDPGLRASTVSVLNAAISPRIESLDEVAWEQLALDPDALEVSEPAARANKNLVLIFLEGLETIYTDEALFPGLTPTLHSLSGEGWQLQNMHQVEGSGWTMAGLVSSLCGTPLLYESSLDGNEVLFSRMLDRATCLPDVLESAGYEQVFMGGAALEFAGKGGFLREHGYDTALGRTALLPEVEDADYVNGWGLYDDSLFALALERFGQLAAADKPFNLTLLTVDTHHPAGNPSASCPDYEAIDNSILHAVHCTDFLLGDFVEQLKRHPAYEDTLLVLVSDHLAMRNNAFALFPMDYQRTLYFNALNADVDKDEQIFATPLDIAPTVLSLLDVEHRASFLAGIDLLETPVEEAERDIDDPVRLNALRYINSNHLSTVESTTIYSLSRLALSELEYSVSIENVAFVEDSLQFDAVTADPYLVLPLLPDADYSDAMLYLTLEAEEKLAVAIYYEEVAGEGYSEENTLRREIEAGLNRMVFDLQAVAAGSRIRIDPGHVPGHYTIREIEIRSK